jgi:hypothetical protein
MSRARDDIIIGKEKRDDTLHGLGGDDLLLGLGGDDRLYGDAGNDRMVGAKGNDRLDGGAGADVMDGGRGNDIYVVDSAKDSVVERIGGACGGIDTVESAIGFSLARLGNVENLTLTGNQDISGTGNALANLLVGNVGINTLSGGGANDTIKGGAGDTLLGQSGNDTLVVTSAALGKADGGSGIDALALDSLGAQIDLTGALGGTLKSIELIDLDGHQANNLVLDPSVVAGLAGTNGAAFGAHTLLVKGDAADTVSLTGTWTADGTVSNPYRQTGTYNVFISGEAKLLLEGEVAVSIPVPATPVPTLGTLDGSNGFALQGAGWISSSAGDINGDGFDDVILGAPGDATHGAGSGAAYVVFGHAGSSRATVDLSALNGSDGFRTYGENDFNGLGTSLSSAGDLNGDGIGDFAVAATWAPGGSGPGYTYIVFGREGPWDPVLDPASLDGTNGLRLTAGAGTEIIGRSPVSAGDLNGDGFDDLIVGGPFASSNGYAAGTTCVIFGHAGGWDPNIDLSTLDGTNGARFVGPIAYTLSGYSVAATGDINGDGFNDLLIGSPSASATAYASGATYVVFGHIGAWDSTFNLGTLSGTNGFTIDGALGDDHSGRAVASAGDINGDGYDDLIIGATGADPNGSYSGASYVVFGHGGAWNSHLALAGIDGTNGFRLDGSKAYDNSGQSLASAGDVNGDGYADLIVGAPLADSSGDAAGSSYLIYGHAGPWAASLALDDLDAATGFRLDGIAPGDESGFSVAAAGDVNGDGYGDLVISALAANGGESYVVYGGNFTGSVMHLGTGGNDTLTGSAAAESFIGGGGNDTILGGGGGDTVENGAGDDQIHVADRTFRHIDGGGGSDTLHLDFAGAIDFGDLDGNAATSDRGKIIGIETISVDNGQNNALTLHLADLLDIDAGNQDIAGNPALDNVLKIDGNAGDTLHLAATEGWGAADTASLDGYSIFASQGVQVAIDTATAVTIG